MSINELKNLLSASADDVRQVQVHQAAIRESKRSTVRRAVVASVAAVAVLGGGIATAGQFAGDAGTVGNTGGAADSGSSIEGTFYDTTFEQSGSEAGHGQKLFSWRAGDEVSKEITPDPAGMYNTTGSVSPDGRYIAYLTEYFHSDPDVADKIRIYNVGSGDVTEVGEYSGYENTCSEPTWSPDGKRLFVDRGTDAGDERTGFIDPETGEFTPMDVPDPCDAKVATDDNGDDLVFTTAQDGDQVEIYVTDPQGNTGKTPVGDALADKGRYITELVAVSPLGTYACVRTDQVLEYDDFMNSRFNTCDTLITMEGDIIELPKVEDAGSWSGGPSVFAFDDRFLVQIDGENGFSWRLYDENGEMVGEIPATDLPTDVEPGVIGFVPDNQ